MAARLLQVFLTLLGVATVVFFIARLSGDPVSLMLPPEATDEQVLAMTSALGLDRPLPVQYWTYISDLAQGDFGGSLRYSDNALNVVMSRLPATLTLAVSSFVMGMVLAFGLAVLGELAHRRGWRTAIFWAAILRQSVPVFWFGLVLIVIFSVWLGWLPAIGNTTWKHYVMPSLTLGTLQLALFLRLFAAAFGESESEDYVRTARAKGTSRAGVVLQHKVPNALLPVVTVAGVNFGFLLTGTVVTETVFSWPGVGRLIVDAVFQRDFPVVQAGIIVTATLFVLVNLAVDILYYVIDPRVRNHR